jgi:hypothetical protein
VYNLNGQKQQHHSTLVQLEEPATGRIFFQQLIKFVEPDIMENDMACQWFSLAERKLSLEGEVEPVRLFTALDDYSVIMNALSRTRPGEFRSARSLQIPCFPCICFLIRFDNDRRFECNYN